MFKKPRFYALAAAVLAVLAAPSVFYGRQSTPQKPVPKVIRLDPAGKDYLRVLSGPPETATMHAGVVTLAPGKSVGKHSTEKFEELVIVLEGRAEMKISGGEVLPLARGFAAYCPPHTEHDVLNTGTGPLRYIYIAAEAEK
jgi:mannose-6-phosphate isomerase-like protein (cupin superfamily)